MICDKNSPIGFFDSGMGGLSVLWEAKKIMPYERFIYFADNLNSPYGNYSDEKIASLSENGIKYLLTKNIKALVIACNTVTAAAVKHIREITPIPVIGMEPAVRPAAKYTKTKKILVLATCATLNQRKFTEYAEAGIMVIPVPCPELASYIENNYYDDEKLYKYINGLIAPYRGHGFDSLVLGCTHYVLKKQIFEKICGCSVEIFDGNYGTAANLYRILEKGGMLSGGTAPSRTKLILTKGDRETYKLYREIMLESLDGA